MQCFFVLSHTGPCKQKVVHLITCQFRSVSIHVSVVAKSKFSDLGLTSERPFTSHLKDVHHYITGVASNIMYLSTLNLSVGQDNIDNEDNCKHSSNLIIFIFYYDHL